MENSSKKCHRYGPLNSGVSQSSAQHKSEERWDELVSLRSFFILTVDVDTRKKPFVYCRISTRHSSSCTSGSFLVFKTQWMEAARRKQGREGEEEGGGNARRRECDRVVMEGWGGREGGTLNLLEEEVWRKGLGKTERGVSLT